MQLHFFVDFFFLGYTVYPVSLHKSVGTLSFNTSTQQKCHIGWYSKWEGKCGCRSQSVSSRLPATSPAGFLFSGFTWVNICCESESEQKPLETRLTHTHTHTLTHTHTHTQTGILAIVCLLGGDVSGDQNIIYRSVGLSVCLLIILFFHTSIHQFFCCSVHPSIDPSVCLSVY